MDLFDKILLFGQIQSCIVKNEFLIKKIEASNPSKEWVKILEDLKNQNFINSKVVNEIESLFNENETISKLNILSKGLNQNEIIFKLTKYDSMNKEIENLKKNI